MTEIVVEQALWRREHERPPELQARSPGFTDAWVAQAQRLLEGFGERTGGVTCPQAVFAQPFVDQTVAIVRAADQEAGLTGWPALAFHVVVVTQKDYEAYLGDPFAVAERVPATWTQRGELPTLTWPAQPLGPRTVAQVQAVLKRIKAGAFREDEDPEAEVERTVENSESPALLGGTQVLVDGGKLYFIRSAPDPALVQGLWTLLPFRARAKLWPASFAFTNDLGFDVVVIPRKGEDDWQGYTSEEQAANYPAGSYELAVQTAAEAGNQAELEAVFNRRSSNDTMRLAWHVLIVMALLVIGGRFFLGGRPPREFTPQRQAQIAARMVGAAAGDPWSALTLYRVGQHLSKIDEDNQR